MALACVMAEGSKKLIRNKKGSTKIECLALGPGLWAHMGYEKLNVPIPRS